MLNETVYLLVYYSKCLPDFVIGAGYSTFRIVIGVSLLTCLLKGEKVILIFDFFLIFLKKLFPYAQYNYTKRPSINQWHCAK